MLDKGPLERPSSSRATFVRFWIWRGFTQFYQTVSFWVFQGGLVTFSHLLWNLGGVLSEHRYPLKTLGLKRGGLYRLFYIFIIFFPVQVRNFPMVILIVVYLDMSGHSGDSWKVVHSQDLFYVQYKVVFVFMLQETWFMRITNCQGQ